MRIISFLLMLLGNIPYFASPMFAQSPMLITNPWRTDGFGAQFQTIIYSTIYAELNNKPFLYTPFNSLEHNYDMDPEFISKKEYLINFIDNFPLNTDPQLQQKNSTINFIAFFEQNLDACSNSQSLKKIQELFRSNKNRADYFSPNRFHIAIHVRRPNSHDTRLDGADTPDAEYVRIIDELRTIYAADTPLFHIYSQGNIEKFTNVFVGNDIVFHIDESIEDTFSGLVLADVLVTSRSSLSYTAGLLSRGVVYYMPFWHPPLSHWHSTNLLRSPEKASNNPTQDIRLSVIGLGKLGAPFVAVLASKGYKVIGVDINPSVVRNLSEGIAPVQEPQLQELISLHLPNIEATHNYEKAVLNSDVTFLILPTPSKADGTFTNEYLLEALEKIGLALTKKSGYHLVVICSTVMPGSMQGEIQETLEMFSQRSVGNDLGLCYNPEFIALGSVIKNILTPDMVLLGQSDEKAGHFLENIHRSICENSPQYAKMNFVNAEITKIAINTYVTTKISYANMLSDLCQKLKNADVDVVTSALGLDSRIGPKYLKGAVAFGGPCFPRDNIAFRAIAKKLGAHYDLAQATHDINSYQTQRLHALVEKHAKSQKIGILGLSYKPFTNVVEESQGIELANLLSDLGYAVSVYDPEGLSNAKPLLHDTVNCMPTAQECLESSDTIFVMTAWPEFTATITPTLLQSQGHTPTIIDCWRILSHKDLSPYCDLVYLGQGEQGD